MRAFVAILALMAIVGCATDQTADMTEPIGVAKGAFESLNQGDFAQFVQFLHPDAIADFENQVQPVLNALVPTDSLGNPVDSINVFGTWQNSEEFLNKPADSVFVDVMSSIFTVAPEIKKTFESISNEYLGGVSQADTAFLVTRTTMEIQGQPYTEMGVVALTKSDGVYKMQMPPQLRGVLDLAFQSLMARRG